MGICEDRVKECLAVIEKDNGRINAFLEVRDREELLDEARGLDIKKEKGKLYGKVIGVKSNINVLGLIASCASKVLENYKSTFDATVIEKIKAEDGIIIGMLNCDEFASGVSGETSAFGPTENPVVPGHVPGGSSSGSGAAVAAGMCDMALGSDTGGSIRNPASFCGVVGVKPSYGAVSRNGLIDLSMSLDQIGPVAKSVEDAALLLDVISGKDERDTTSVEIGDVKLARPSGVKVGVVRFEGVDENVEKVVDEAISKMGWDSEEVEIKYIDLAVQSYYLLLWAEFFSATRRFDGRKYGKKIEEACGPEVLRRIIGGGEVAKAEFKGQYYDKALDARDVIAAEFERCFAREGFDCLVMPTVPVLPWKLGEKTEFKDWYLIDALTIPANLAGVCAVSVPVGDVEGKPVGMQIVCGKGEESKMLSIAREVENVTSH